MFSILNIIILFLFEVLFEDYIQEFMRDYARTMPSFRHCSVLHESNQLQNWTG